MEELTASLVSNGHPGARWWKVDFHAHSPASFDFGADEGKRALVKTSYREWLLAYMRAGIDALIIADHNTHEGIDEARAELDKLRIEQSDDFRELALLSGIEFTVDGGYHLLGVFDVDTPSETINGLLHVCGFEAERGSSEGTTKKSFAEVVKEIVEQNGLAIPAHADVAKGLFKHDLRNQSAIVEEQHIVAVEVVTEAGAKEAEKRGWVHVLGSDAHHLDDSGCPEGIEAKYPGSHFTWVKMEQPNLLGIKLALSDGSQSVIPARSGGSDPNSFSHTFIEEVLVRKGPEQANFCFGPWMNAIIGGRGVGKSTVVELVRLAMGRFSDLPMSLQSDGNWFSPTPGSGATSRFWTRGTTVEVHIARRGRKYRVMWGGEDPGTSTIEIFEDGEWVPEGGRPRDRFPVLINSQKQIYETARDPQSLLKALDDQASVGFPAWQERFDELSGQYRTQRSKIHELHLKIASEERLNGELSDIQIELDHLVKIRDSDEAKELDRLTQEEQAAVRFEELAGSFERAIAELLEEFSSLAQTEEDATEEAPAELWEEEAKRQATVSATFASLAVVVENLTDSRTQWDEAQNGSPRRNRIEELIELLREEEPETAASMQSEDSNVINQRLLTSKREKKDALAEIKTAKELRPKALSLASELLADIVNHRAGLTQRRSELATTLSGSDLKLQVLAQADESQLEKDLRRLVQKPSSFDPVFAPDGLTSILGNPFAPRRDERVAELKKMLIALPMLGSPAALREHYPDLAIEQRFFSHVSTLDAFSYETEVNLWFPDDRLRVRYRQDGAPGLSEIDEGSPGQKTAALLAVVLQLSDDPLLLDQPEDDLDNKLIYDLVVATLKRIKSHRQVIVVTHNANVVVNADAEHVMVLQHGNIPQIEANGSMQAVDIKQSICLIMEGGEPAFEARYKRLMS